MKDLKTLRRNYLAKKNRKPTSSILFEMFASRGNERGASSSISSKFEKDPARGKPPLARSRCLHQAARRIAAVDFLIAIQSLVVTGVRAHFTWLRSRAGSSWDLAGEEKFPQIVETLKAKKWF